MKTKTLKVSLLIALTGALGLGLGEGQKPGDAAKPEAAPTAPATPATAVAPPAPSTNPPAPPREIAEAPEKPAPLEKPAGAPGTASGTATNVSAPAPRLVQSATPPPNLKLSPALAEVVKMVQAGIGDEVLLTYISNSTNVFYMGADEIVYLNDLGVSQSVITTLIQQDASPDAMARKQAATAMNPLPPAMKLTSPATNIYPTTAAPPATGDAVPGNYVYEQPVAAPPPEPTPVDTAPPTTQVTSVSYFYDSLAPYGNWVSVPEYGLCWQPTVAVVDTGWRPYSSNGRWIWSDAGWYWYSGYSWGWAPFHYGRWCSYPGYGWLWAPDTYWGPSWVTWRYTPYHCGWAPLPPACSYVSGFGLYYGGASVGIGFGFGYGWGAYTYLPTAYMCHPNPHRYYAHPSQAKEIYQNSTVVNNYIVGDNNTIINNGIGLDRVSKVHRGEIPKATIRDASYTRAHDVRMERLERHDSGLTVVRPTLPKQPPISPAALASRTQSEVAKDRPVRASRPAAASGNLVPASSSGALRGARSDSPSTGASLPSRPDSRASVAGVEQPRSTSSITTPARIQPSSVTSRSAQESTASARGTATPAASTSTSRPSRAAQEPASRSATQAPAAPSRSAPTPAAAPQTIPGRASTSVAPTRPPTPVTPAPAATPARPTRSEPRSTTAPAARGNVVPGNATGARSPQVSRPDRANPSAAPVPTPRSVPGSSFYNSRPVSQPPSVSRPAAPPSFAPSAPSVAPSRPAPSFRSEPAAPSRSFSAPSAPAPSRSFSAPSAPAPSRSAPAPSSGSSGGGGSRPSRPGRS